MQQAFTAREFLLPRTTLDQARAGPLSETYFATEEQSLSSEGHSSAKRMIVHPYPGVTAGSGLRPVSTASTAFLR